MQALWTMARERLNVTVIVLANREYAILKHEYVRMAAATMGDRARSMLSLGIPIFSLRDWPKDSAFRR